MAVVSVQNMVSAVVVMAAVVAVVATNAVIVQMSAQRVAQRVALKVALNNALKVAQKVGAMSDVNAITSHAAQISAVLSHAVNSAMKARSSVSHAHRANHVSPVKVLARSVLAVNAANAQSEAMSSDHRWMLPSKTSRWPTRPPWRQPWAVRQLIQAWRPHAANVEIGGANAVAATNAVMNHRANHVQNHEQIARTLQMHRPPSQLDR